MIKKLNVFSVIVLFVLVVISLFCCFNKSSVVFADSSSVSSYSFRGSNIGYVSPGFASAVNSYSFSTLSSTVSDVDGCLFSASFSTVNKDNYGVAYSPEVVFNINLSLINRQIYLFPIGTITVDDTTYYRDNICKHFASDTSIVTDYCESTLNTNDYSFDYSYTLFGSYDKFYLVQPNSFVSNQVVSFNAIRLSPRIISDGSSAINRFSLMYSAFRLGDVSSFNYNYEVADYFRNVNVSSIEIGSNFSWNYGNLYNASLTGAVNNYFIDLDVTNDSNLRFNYILYKFETGASLLFVVGCQSYDNSSTYTDSFLWDYRNYYLTNDFINQNSYNIGYSNGYDSAYSVGYQDGLGVGLVNGQQYGESIGYARGVSDAGNYTFFSLISAVIDAPIQAFTSLFNFEFLGFNLLNFITGLLTLAFVIWIIRLIL